MVFLYKELNIFRYIKRKDIDRGHIHRNGNQRQAPCFTALQPAAHFFPDKLIQVRDETVFFQYGNEHKRRNHRTVRFYPPGQRFSPHNTGCWSPALGLQVENNLVVFQRRLEIRKDLVVRRYLCIHGRIKVPDTVFKIRLGVTHGETRLIVEAHHRILFLGIADADGREESYGHPVAHNSFVKIVKQLFHL